MAENNFFPCNGNSGDRFGRNYRNYPCDHRNQYRDSGNYWGQGQDCNDCPRGLRDGRGQNDDSCGNEWQGNRDIHIHNNNANTNQSNANANSGACVRRDGGGERSQYPNYCRGGGGGSCGRRDNDGGGQRRESVNLNLNIGCVCAQGTGVGSGGNASGNCVGESRGYGYGNGNGNGNGNSYGGYGSGSGGGNYRGMGFGGYESSMIPYLGGNKRAEYCVCCGQVMRFYGGRGLVCCEVGWRPRFDGRERRRCGLARCLLGR